MKTKININGNDVEITLTSDQVEQIKKASQKITDRVKTFEDACQIASVSDNVRSLLNYNGPDEDMKASQAHAKIVIIARALNEGWKPDWSNTNQVKYYPWFKYSPGSGFSYGDYGSDWTDSYVGSRLCFKSRELAKYAGKQFEQLYKDYFLIE